MWVYAVWLLFFMRCFQTGFILPNGDCEFRLRDPSGQIYSPGFEKARKYPNNTECNWSITVDESNTIVLQFYDMFLEYYENCIYDFVHVYETLDIDHGMHCGYRLPAPIMSRTNSLFVRFSSDSSITDLGFNATYRSRIGLKLCEPVITNSDGKFGPVQTDSQGFYENNVRCAWRIVSLTPGKRVQVYFTWMDIPSNNNCDQDYIEVIDFNTSVGVYCGNVQPSVIISTYHSIYIHFVTDESISGKGFEAHYIITNGDLLCGGILTEPNGRVQSPDPDNDGLYEADVHCYWILIAPEGKIIELNFTFVSLLSYEICHAVSVRVYDSEIVFGALIADICGTDTPTIWSTTNILKVTFYNYKYDSRRSAGFKAEYSHHFKDSSTPHAVTPISPFSASTENFAVSMDSANTELTSVQQTSREFNSSPSATDTATKQGNDVSVAITWNTSTLLNEPGAITKRIMFSLESLSTNFTGHAAQHSTTELRRTRTPTVENFHRSQLNETAVNSTESINQTTTNIGESTCITEMVNDVGTTQPLDRMATQTTTTKLERTKMKIMESTHKTQSRVTAVKSTESLNRTTVDIKESTSNIDWVNDASTTQESRKRNISTHSVDISSTFDLNTEINTTTPVCYFLSIVICMANIFLLMVKI